MMELDTTPEVSLVEESPWDDINEVDFEFVKTGKSKGDGILTTHNGNFKVVLIMNIVNNVIIDTL